jgi:uncharacterized integral membrane protein
MLRRIVFVFILAPLALLMVALAVANRAKVTISFDPFSATHPAFAATLPLWGLAFILLIVGVVIGGVAAWLAQRRWRGAARRLEAENRALKAEVISLRRHVGPRMTLPAALDPAPRVLRPPAA